MKFGRSNKFDLCYYGQVNSLRLKSNVVSNWQVKTFGGNTYFAVDGTLVQDAISVFFFFYCIENVACENQRCRQSERRPPLPSPPRTIASLPGWPDPPPPPHLYTERTQQNRRPHTRSVARRVFVTRDNKNHESIHRNFDPSQKKKFEVYKNNSFIQKFCGNFMESQNILLFMILI